MFPAIDARAYSDGAYIVTSDFLNMIGTEIEFEYYNGSGYVTSVFRYVNTQANGGFEALDSSYSYISSQPFLLFRCDTPSDLSYDPTAITVKLDPIYSIIDTEQINTWIALSASGPVSSDAYQSSTWDWYYSDVGSVRHTSPEYSQSWTSGRWNNSYFLFIPAMHVSQSVGSGYASTARFYGAKGSYYGQYMFLAIGVPYVSTDAIASSGTFAPAETTTPGTGTDINVNVNVDMTETNGILSGIKQGIDNIVTGILNGLKALFIPSDDFMDEFKSDMEDLAEDHLGGLYEAESILVDMFEQFPEVASKNEIYIEPVNIPLAGETLTLGNWHVPLKVAGIPSIFYDGLAFIIDFLCLMAFLRMCRNKLEIFLNPDTEVIK